MAKDKPLLERIEKAVEREDTEQRVNTAKRLDRKVNYVQKRSRRVP